MYSSPENMFSIQNIKATIKVGLIIKHDNYHFYVEKAARGIYNDYKQMTITRCCYVGVLE